MSMKQKITIIILIVVSVVLAVLGSVAYYERLNKTIDDSILQNMKEMSEHDVKNIQATLDSTWRDLESTGARLGVYRDRIEDLEQFQAFLNVEKVATFFSKIYMVDTSGNVYTDTNIFSNDIHLEYVQDLMNGVAGQTKCVGWYHKAGSNVVEKESLLYGVTIDKISISIKNSSGITESIEFVGVIGIANIIDIAKTLEISSFDGRGYSMVIDYNGDYVVRPSDETIKQTTNYFDWFKTGTFYNNENANDVISKVKNNESLSIKYTNGDNDPRIVTFTSIPETEWCLILSIPLSILLEQSSGFMWMTILVLMILILAFLVFLFVIVKMWSTSHYAKAESKVKGEFLSSMSHEIRTPLNGLIGLNHLMKQNVDDPEKLHNYLEKSDVTASYLLTLINDILDFSKLQSGKVELESKPYDLASTVDNVVTMFQDRMKQKQITFNVNLFFEHSVILGDETRLKQVIINILGNAVKFTPEEGTISLNVSQELKESKVFTKFIIKDTGCGMSKEFISKIFDSFSQENNDVSKANQGTGLGMPISKIIIEKMGGEILVESEANVGSTFTVIFPATMTTLVSKEKEAPVKKNKKKLRVLVAEDNELNAEIMQDILELEGFTVVIASNGQIALDIFKESKPNEFDVILMDGQMPVMNGFEATKAIRSLDRKDAKEIKIFACTANTISDERTRAIESGMDGLIPKPIDIEKMLNLLNKE